MSLKDKLQEDLKTSLKAGDSARATTLRMVMASIMNKEKEGKEVGEEQLQDVIASEVKKRRESKEAFVKGGRPELAEKEEAELEVLLPYLPEQLTEDEIKDLVTKAILKTGAQDQKDMGKVMGELSPQVKGKADGSLVAKIVQQLLGSS